jgi:hypothetical protein
MVQRGLSHKMNSEHAMETDLVSGLATIKDAEVEEKRRWKRRWKERS